MKVLCNHIIAGDKLFSLLLAEPFKLNLEDYNQLMKSYRTSKLDFVVLMRQQNNWKDSGKVEEFLENYKYLQEFIASNDLRSSVVEIINRTGILTSFQANKKNRMENFMGIKR